MSCVSKADKELSLGMLADADEKVTFEHAVV